MKLEILAEVPFAVQIHAVAALGALATGLPLLILPRGRVAHRTLGIMTAVLLVVTAVSAGFIMQLNKGLPSLLHLFIPLTAIGLFGTAMALAKRDWKSHRNAARRLIYGALVIPGIIAFMPGRLLHIIAFS